MTARMAADVARLGGTIQTGHRVTSLEENGLTFFDTSPRAMTEIAGDQLPARYRTRIERFRYGPGIFKVDWALAGEIPWMAEECRRTATVHLGGMFEEIVQAEEDVASGRHPEEPFAILTQASLFDPSRAPEGKQLAWAYCHVPNGSRTDMTSIIEKQVERFAPGFRERILARHVFNTEQMEAYNPNYIGGDINGGILDIGQLFTRPALRSSPYRTSAKGLYICSSSTPPGGGVHGMCGYHAAKRALKDVFNASTGSA